MWFVTHYTESEKKNGCIDTWSMVSTEYALLSHHHEAEPS